MGIVQILSQCWENYGQGNRDTCETECRMCAWNPHCPHGTNVTVVRVTCIMGAKIGMFCTAHVSHGSHGFSHGSHGSISRFSRFSWVYLTVLTVLTGLSHGSHGFRAGAFMPEIVHVRRSCCSIQAPKQISIYTRSPSQTNCRAELTTAPLWQTSQAGDVAARLET